MNRTVIRRRSGRRSASLNNPNIRRLGGRALELVAVTDPSHRGHPGRPEHPTTKQPAGAP